MNQVVNISGYLFLLLGSRQSGEERSEEVQNHLKIEAAENS